MGDEEQLCVSTWGCDTSSWMLEMPKTWRDQRWMNGRLIWWQQLQESKQNAQFQCHLHFTCISSQACRQYQKCEMIRCKNKREKAEACPGSQDGALGGNLQEVVHRIVAISGHFWASQTDVIAHCMTWLFLCFHIACSRLQKSHEILLHKDRVWKCRNSRELSIVQK